MNPERMLEKCRRDQWKVDDLDWSVAPRPMRPDEEMAIVQYFTDMAGIERLAGALFEEQRKRVSDPTLQKIFATFVADEERHARTAERLAAYYDVNKLKTYRANDDLARFRPHFVDAIRYLSAEVANVYITTGELILDVALLRSIDDYVHDAMSASAMELINRDESRHVAMDYYMFEYYASDDYQRERAQAPRKSVLHHAKAWWAFAHVLYYGKPFFQEVFFRPMERVDPSGRRMREAMKRAQLLGVKPSSNTNPAVRFLMALPAVANHPVFGPVFGDLAARIAGVPTEFMRNLYSEDEAARAARMSYDELAEEALAAKTYA